MGNKKDLTGQHFGKWTVLYEAPKQGQRTMWHCKCECGKERDVWSGSLLHGSSNSCGCNRPANCIDLIGQRFGRLTVIERADNRPNKTGAYWKCKCDCGNITIVSSNDLRYGHTKSCGCYNIDRIIERNTKHGKSNTRLYNIWMGIKDRIYRETTHGFDRYGGRGLTMCDEWKDDFLLFEKWSLENGYDDLLSIDRIDNNKGYFPDNCRWVNAYAQANNTRKNVYIAKDGETHTLAEWCRLKNLNYDMVRGRVKRGWDISKLFIPSARVKSS